MRLDNQISIKCLKFLLNIFFRTNERGSYLFTSVSQLKLNRLETGTDSTFNWSRSGARGESNC